MRGQGTLARPFSQDGIGLHSGQLARVTVEPAPPGHGRVFWRVDLSAAVAIPALARNVVDARLATTLGVGEHRVTTVEHLVAALASEGIDNARVLLEGPEVPVLDGSALPWVQAIREAGREDQGVPVCGARILRRVAVGDASRHVAVSPASTFEVRLTVDYDHPLLRERTLHLVLGDGAFEREVAWARTFGFQADIEAMLRSGRARGGNLDCALVFDPRGVLNPSGQRGEDEAVRHKILDLVGDLGLFGMPILGRFDALRPGHALHVALIEALNEQTDAWTVE